jgi:phenylacetate-coenzyme A ligase PaaK-like adenylate-forming protein
VIWESSGTSGQPGVFVQDVQAMAVYDALEALRRSVPQSLQRWMDPLYLGERIAFVGATGGHFASHVSIERLRQLNPWMATAVRGFSILQPTAALVTELNAFAPTVVATYPTAAALLADQRELGHLQIPLREVWTGGETLRPTVRQRIERTMGCTVRNSYGASEFLTMGWECAHGHMHVNADWVILEPVDEQYRPVPAGTPSYSTLLTHLGNTVQPLIRYDLGDQITLHPDRCLCGSSLPVIDVQGRCDDVLVMAGREGQSVTLLPLALTTVLEDQAGVFDFQLRQHDAHTLVLRLPQKGDEAKAAMARCRAALQGFAAAQGIRPFSLVEEPGQAVPRGRSGKACRVIARRA